LACRRGRLRLLREQLDSDPLLGGCSSESFDFHFHMNMVGNAAPGFVEMLMRFLFEILTKELPFENGGFLLADPAQVNADQIVREDLAASGPLSAFLDLIEQGEADLGHLGRIRDLTERAEGSL